LTPKEIYTQPDGEGIHLEYIVKDSSGMVARDMMTPGPEGETYVTSGGGGYATYSLK
jgi:hypothetical protein